MNKNVQNASPIELRKTVFIKANNRINVCLV